MFRWETPTEGGLWHGALRSGQTGLFKPEDTVAYLGAENPISSNTAKLLQLTKENKPTKKRSSEKLTDKEKRKLLISEPQGLKHTCHVGLDGSLEVLSFDNHISRFRKSIRANPCRWFTFNTHHKR